MVKALKRSLIVLVPTLIAMLLTWLGPARVLRDRMSGELYVLLDLGSLVLLVVLTAWTSARFGDLGRRAAAMCGALVVLLGRVLPLLVFATVMGWRSGRWDRLGWLTVAGVFLVLLALPLAYFGAWIATRGHPKPQHP